MSVNLTVFYDKSIYLQLDWTEMVDFSCLTENFICADGTAVGDYCLSLVF